jgi:hypothetical protein
MSDCPFPPAHANGPDCFARILEHEYLDLGSKARTESALGGYLAPRTQLSIITDNGIAVGWPWRILNTHAWHIGQDKMWGDGIPIVGPFLAGSTRSLQETELVHVTRGWRLRFFNTHTSHDTGDGWNEVDNSDQRKSQIEKIREIVSTHVAAGELPPIVVGDFNCKKDDPENTMSQDFDFACDDGDREHIWVGRHASFPQTMGSYTTLWTTTVFSGGHEFDGIDLPTLTGSHNSPGAGFKVEM